MAIPGQEKGITLGDIPIREGGKRIIADELKFGKPEYGSKRIENLAKDLEGSIADIYRCIQFAKKYPELSHTVRELSFGKREGMTETTDKTVRKQRRKGPGRPFKPRKSGES